MWYQRGKSDNGTKKSLCSSITEIDPLEYIVVIHKTYKTLLSLVAYIYVPRLSELLLATDSAITFSTLASDP